MDLNITPVATQLKPPQTMSLADMINVGRGGIQLQKERQANTERVGLQDFFSNPENFQTDGNIDMTKVNAAIPKIFSEAVHVPRVVSVLVFFIGDERERAVMSLRLFECFHGVQHKVQ